MISLTDYFNFAKINLGFPTKAKLAEHLGMRPQELNRAITEGYCSDQVIEKIAEITGSPAVMVFAARELSKPQSEAMKKVWYQIFINLVRSQSEGKLFTTDEKSKQKPTIATNKDYRK